VRVAARSRQRIGRRHSLVEGKKRCGSRGSGERLRERRIQLHGVVEVAERWSKLAPVEEIAPAEVEIVRRLTRRPARFGDRDRLHTGYSPTPTADSAAERRGDRAGQLFLQGENVGHSSIEALRPQTQPCG